MVVLSEDIPCFTFAIQTTSIKDLRESVLDAQRVLLGSSSDEEINKATAYASLVQKIAALPSDDPPLIIQPHFDPLSFPIKPEIEKTLGKLEVFIANGCDFEANRLWIHEKMQQFLGTNFLGGGLLAKSSILLVPAIRGVPKSIIMETRGSGDKDEDDKEITREAMATSHCLIAMIPVCAAGTAFLANLQESGAMLDILKREKHMCFLDNLETQGFGFFDPKNVSNLKTKIGLLSAKVESIAMTIHEKCPQFPTADLIKTVLSDSHSIVPVLGFSLVAKLRQDPLGLSRLTQTWARASNTSLEQLIEMTSVGHIVSLITGGSPDMAAKIGHLKRIEDVLRLGQGLLQGLRSLPSAVYEAIEQSANAVKAQPLPSFSQFLEEKGWMDQQKLLSDKCSDVLLKMSQQCKSSLDDGERTTAFRAKHMNDFEHSRALFILKGTTTTPKKLPDFLFEPMILEMQAEWAALTREASSGLISEISKIVKGDLEKIHGELTRDVMEEEDKSTLDKVLQFSLAKAENQMRNFVETKLSSETFRKRMDQKSIRKWAASILVESGSMFLGSPAFDQHMQALDGQLSVSGMPAGEPKEHAKMELHFQSVLGNHPMLIKKLAAKTKSEMETAFLDRVKLTIKSLQPELSTVRRGYFDCIASLARINQVRTQALDKIDEALSCIRLAIEEQKSNAETKTLSSQEDRLRIMTLMASPNQGHLVELHLPTESHFNSLGMLEREKIHHDATSVARNAVPFDCPLRALASSCMPFADQWFSNNVALPMARFLLECPSLFFGSQCSLEQSLACARLAEKLCTPDSKSSVVEFGSPDFELQMEMLCKVFAEVTRICVRVSSPQGFKDYSPFGMHKGRVEIFVDKNKPLFLVPLIGRATRAQCKASDSGALNLSLSGSAFEDKTKPVERRGSPPRASAEAHPCERCGVNTDHPLSCAQCTLVFCSECITLPHGIRCKRPQAAEPRQAEAPYTERKRRESDSESDENQVLKPKLPHGFLPLLLTAILQEKGPTKCCGLFEEVQKQPALASFGIDYKKIHDCLLRNTTFNFQCDQTTHEWRSAHEAKVGSVSEVIQKRGTASLKKRKMNLEDRLSESMREFPGKQTAEEFHEILEKRKLSYEITSIRTTLTRLKAKRHPRSSTTASPIPESRHPSPTPQIDKEANPTSSRSHYTQSELNLLDQGLEKYGWGAWSEISEHFVKTRNAESISAKAVDIYEGLDGWKKHSEKQQQTSASSASSPAVVVVATTGKASQPSSNTTTKPTEKKSGVSTDGQGEEPQKTSREKESVNLPSRVVPERPGGSKRKAVEMESGHHDSSEPAVASGGSAEGEGFSNDFASNGGGSASNAHPKYAEPHGLLLHLIAAICRDNPMTLQDLCAKISQVLGRPITPRQIMTVHVNTKIRRGDAPFEFIPCFGNPNLNVITAVNPEDLARVDGLTVDQIIKRFQNVPDLVRMAIRESGPLSSNEIVEYVLQMCPAELTKKEIMICIQNLGKTQCCELVWVGGKYRLSTPQEKEASAQQRKMKKAARRASTNEQLTEDEDAQPEPKRKKVTRSSKATASRDKTTTKRKSSKRSPSESSEETEVEEKCQHASSTHVRKQRRTSADQSGDDEEPQQRPSGKNKDKRKPESRPSKKRSATSQDAPNKEKKGKSRTRKPAAAAPTATRSEESAADLLDDSEPLPDVPKRSKSSATEKSVSATVDQVKANAAPEKGEKQKRDSVTTASLPDQPPQMSATPADTTIEETETAPKPEEKKNNRKRALSSSSDGQASPKNQKTESHGPRNGGR